MKTDQPTLNQLTAARADADRLRGALGELLERYTALANSGDCGNWDPETEPQVIAAKRALAEGGES